MLAKCHQLTSFANMFEDCVKLTEINLSSFNTKEAKDLSFMFFGGEYLTSIDTFNFITNKVTN